MKYSILFIVGLLSLSILTCNAQNRKIYKEFHRLFEVVPYVFDGEVVDVECFGVDLVREPNGFVDYAHIYTGSYIKVHRVYKGNIQEGQIVCMVDRGGGVQMPDGSYRVLKRTDGTRSFCVGAKGLFCFQDADIIKKDYSDMLYLQEYSYKQKYIIYNDNLIYDNLVFWKSYESFYIFLSKYEFLNVPEYDNTDGFYPEPEDNAKSKKAFKKKADAQFADTSGKCVNKNII